MKRILFIDNCWKDKAWRSTTTLRQKVVDVIYYKSEIFKSLVVGIVVLGFALGFQKKGIICNE